MLKTKNLISIITVIAITTTANIASAKHKDLATVNNYFYSTAKVINIEPIVKTIQVSTPKKECWEEEITRPVMTHHNSGTGNVVFGGLVGGIVGNQFGHGRGKTAATVVGSIIGATIGNDISKKQHYVTRSKSVDIEHHCKVSQIYHTEQQVEGYWVSYRYKGEVFTTRMDEEPGKRLKIRVQVSPVLN